MFKTRSVTRKEKEGLQLPEDQSQSSQSSFCTMESMLDMMEELKKELAGINNSISNLNTNFNNKLDNFMKDISLKCENNSKSITLLNNKIDDLEQRSRRSNLRLFGVKELQNENTDEAVIHILNDKLNLNLTINDIERSHRVGALSPNKIRAIIIKFNNYRIRQLVYSSKSKLKGTALVLREDLTARRHKKYMELQGVYGKSNCWTRDGNVLFKVNADVKLYSFDNSN
uniref:Uncharacterized protein n=1 Tax=Photinus pyralis TaxID=7054 RepID=A0A1Y1NGB3_PHOPY